MMDCTNVEVRDLLPEYAAGRLGAVERERVERHLAGCAECTDELSLIRAAARAFGEAPAVDVARIVAALPARARGTPQGVVPIESRRRAPAARRPAWSASRRVAAIAAVAVGAIGLAIAGGDRATRRVGDTALADPPVVVTAPVVAESQAASGIRAPVAQVAAASGELSLASGVAELSDESLRALMGDLEQLDDSTLTEPGDLLPTMTGVDDEAGV